MLTELIRQIVAEQHNLATGDITTNTDFFQDLDDSLDFAQIVMTCEEEFDIVIPNSEVSEIRTVGDLISCVQRHMEIKANVWPPSPSA